MLAKDKTILVTGAANGIGRAVTLLLLKKGATVMAADRDENGLDETFKLANSYQEKLYLYPLNVADKKSVENLKDDLLKNHKALDGYINVAGIIHPFVKVNELAYDRIEKVLDVNLYGTIYMVKTFLPHLLTRPEAHIVHISSIGALLPVPGQTIYGASKAAVKLMTEGLYSELMDTPVDVTLVMPGAVGTQITENSQVDIKNLEDMNRDKIKVITAEKAAQMIVTGMEKNAYHVLAGPDAKIIYRLARLAPKKAASLIAKQTKSLLS